MSKKEWTHEQRTAINHSGSSAIVSAAAGSGKTAVLVERVKRILMDEENKISADEIVLVTYTKKAAAELKLRLDKALAEAEAQSGGNEYLRQQRIKLEDANISTISAFCMRLLREYCSCIDLSPDFGVLDEADSEVMKEKVISDVLEEFYKNGDKEKIKLLYDWYGGESDVALEKSIRYIYDFMRKLPDAKKAMGEWLDVYQNPDKYYSLIKQNVLKNRLIPLYNEMAAIAPAVQADDTDALKEFIKDVEDYKTMAKQCTTGDEIAMLCIVSRKIPAINLTSVKKERREEISEARDALKALCLKFKKAANAIAYLKDHYNAAAPVFEELLDLAEKVDEEYSARKRLKNKIDFADGELLVIKLLKDESVAETIRSGISAIIVDEFQDSNDVQYDIFCKLSKNKTNLFFVGDIKQSIYRFRGANPRVFNRVIEEAKKENSVFKHITLNRNFRSSDKVISAVNAIFEGTMTKQVGEVDYDDSHKLVQGTDYKTGPEDIAELVCFSGGNVGDLRKKEADYIAQRIKQMVNSGYQVTENGQKRPCRYGDFAVLMGKYRFNAFIYKKAFDAHRVPYIAKEDGAFTDYYEIKLLLSFLKIIDNPYKNVDMATVLMLPPYNFTAEELCEIRLAGKGENERPNKFLYTGLIDYAKSNPKAKKFLDDLKALRDYSTEHSPEQVVRKIYDESETMSVILAMFDGEKRESNVKRFISYAKKYSENGLKGLSDFISYMDNLTQSDVNVAQAENAAMSENAVQIMTIHSSKGLEFPICFISNLTSVTDKSVVNSLTNKKKLKLRYAGEIVADIDAGVGFQVVDRKNNLILNTYPFEEISECILAQEESEEMRLLYVALTRAKEKLIITSPVKSEKTMGGHLKWIYESKAGANARDGEIKEEDRILKIIHNPVIAIPDENASNEQESASLNIRLSPKYRYAKVNEHRAKATATQLGVKSADYYSETSDHIDRFIKLPSFLAGSEEKALSGKKKGDAYHKVMELIDFSGDASQVDELYEKGLITKAERECINIAQIEKFLDSELCKQINSADRVEKEFPIFFRYTPEDFPKDVPEDEERPFVQGIADLFYIKNNKITLVDYKTNKIKKVEDFIEEYRGQLKIYKQALEEIFGMEVEACYLYAFNLDKTGRAVKVEI